jgi:glycerol kinase
MKYILALDQGTTSSRAILFDTTGRARQSAQQEFKQIFPHPGWVEHDAQQIWSSQLAVAMQLFSTQHEAESFSVEDVAAIAITNQRETTILWDRATGQPLANAIVWQDRRTADACDALRMQGHQPLIQTRTGLILDSYFSATKLQWLLDNIPGARERAERGELAFGTVDTWLVWNLSAGRLHVTDPSNASRTMLFNLHSLDWDEELLKLFNIPRNLMPHIVPTSGVLGQTDPALFGRAIPIASIVGDQQGATFGQACLTPGMAKNTYGTGCFMLMNTGHEPVPSMNRLLTTIGWQIPDTQTPQSTPAAMTAGCGEGGCGTGGCGTGGCGTGGCSTGSCTTCNCGPGGCGTRVRTDITYCLEASVFMGGATIQWLRDGLGIIQTAAEVEALAASVPDVADVYLVPAFTGLGAPIWDGHARGTLIGMTRGTTKAHIARAALEAIALQVTSVLCAMEKDAGIKITELRVDGGASKNDLLMQMQADFLGIAVVRPQIIETTALGAAYLAGLAVGIWSSPAEISAQWAVEHRFEPTTTTAQRTAKLNRWKQAVDRARGWSED